MTRFSTRLKFGTVLLGGLALIAVPTVAQAASATNTLPLLAGSLSIGALSPTTLPSTSVSAGTVSGAIDQGNWTDGTGTGLGWHGTLQTAALVYQGAFTQTAGTTTAITNAASGAYTGTVGNAIITVTVSTATSSGVTQVTWSDREAATTTGGPTPCTNGSACTISNGVTITFTSATVYPVGAAYTAEVGALPASGMTIATASATGPTPQTTTLGGSNLPTFEGNGSVVTAGGSAVPFVHATALEGIGTFQLAAGVTITWDANNTWGGASVTYVGVAQYAISSGP
jgi:hypothetical protein